MSQHTKIKLFYYFICFVLLLIAVYKLNNMNKLINVYESSPNSLHQIKVAKKRLNQCLNEVFANNSMSIWTFLTDDSNYVTGAIKLLKSIESNLDSAQSVDKIIMELTEKPLKEEMKNKLLDAGWTICQVNRIAPRDEANTYPRFRDQFTKLVLWKMVEYKAIVYFDSDAFVVGKLDSLLNAHKKLDGKPYSVACTRDIRAGVWQDAFNMGVFTVRPNLTEYERLIMLKNDQNFKFETTMSEQGFLNVVYKDKWFDFGFENNANLAVYSQINTYWMEREKRINVIHYTMEKPWACGPAYKDVCDKWRSFVVK